MKLVFQRVSSASVSVEGKVISDIGRGAVILLGVSRHDSVESASRLAEKAAKLRVFSDENDKLNLSLLDIGGEALVISNFTVCGDASHGHRPSFTASADYETARILYELFMKELKNSGVKRVCPGVFGADMQVSLVNDGPVTLIMEV